MQGSHGLLETNTRLTKLTATQQWIISVLPALRTLGQRGLRQNCLVLEASLQHIANFKPVWTIKQQGTVISIGHCLGGSRKGFVEGGNHS